MSRLDCVDDDVVVADRPVSQPSLDVEPDVVRRGDVEPLDGRQRVLRIQRAGGTDVDRSSARRGRELDAQTVAGRDRVVVRVVRQAADRRAGRVVLHLLPGEELVPAEIDGICEVADARGRERRCLRDDCGFDLVDVDA